MSTVERPYHHGSLRRALLERAEELLAASGARELSLRELARDIGVSHAAPRRHFPDKQALLDALAESGFTRLGEELRAAIAESGPGFEARLAALARAYVRFAVAHSALLDLMYATKHRDGAGAALRTAATAAFEAPLALIAEGQASGDVVAGDVERVALSAWATIHGAAAMAATGLTGDVPLDDLVGAVVDRLVLGLRPR